MKDVTVDSDPYLPMLCKHWDALTGMYVAFEALAATQNPPPVAT